MSIIVPLCPYIFVVALVSVLLPHSSCSFLSISSHHWTRGLSHIPELVFLSLRLAHIWLIWLFWYIQGHNLLHNLKIFHPVCKAESLYQSLQHFTWSRQVCTDTHTHADWERETLRTFPLCHEWNRILVPRPTVLYVIQLQSVFPRSSCPPPHYPYLGHTELLQYQEHALPSLITGPCTNLSFLTDCPVPSSLSCYMFLIFLVPASMSPLR